MYPRRCDYHLGDDWWPGRETVEVIVPEEERAIDTGLLDQFGGPIRRYPVRRPLGFCR
jgi:hypothetical protein